MIPEIFRFTANCTIVIIGTKTYYYSSHTLVGFSGGSDKIRVNSISKTMEKHLTKMGIKEFPVAESYKEFLAFIEK